MCWRWDRLRDRSCNYLSTSRSLPSVVYFEYCGFLLYRTEPSVKKFDVVDCDFLTVPLILAVPFFFFFQVLFLNHCRIYCTLGWICHNLLATCEWIRRIYLVFLEFIEKKRKIGLKNGYGNLGSNPFGRWILRFYPVFCQMHWKRKWKFGVKIAYGNFGYLSLVAWMLRIYLFFLTFTDQMEN